MHVIPILKDFQPTLRFMNAADRDTEVIRLQRKGRILQADASTEKKILVKCFHF